MKHVKLQSIAVIHTHPTQGRCWGPSLRATATISPDGTLTVDVDGDRYLLWRTRYGEVVAYLRGNGPQEGAVPASLRDCRDGGYVEIDTAERAAVDATLGELDRIATEALNRT